MRTLQATPEPDPRRASLRMFQLGAATTTTAGPVRYYGPAAYTPPGTYAFTITTTPKG